MEKRGRGRGVPRYRIFCYECVEVFLLGQKKKRERDERPPSFVNVLGRVWSVSVTVEMGLSTPETPKISPGKGSEKAAKACVWDGN